jgi:hypothetical protein
MKLRITLFISLLTLFYIYCRQDASVNNYRETNDINMIEMPAEISPTLQYEFIPQAKSQIDTLYSPVSLPFADFELSASISNFPIQN